MHKERSPSFPYDRMIHKALRSVIREVLLRIAQNGPTEDQHFYLTFNTQADGVQLPFHLLSGYPKEMTIVLQHRFRDLEVLETSFRVCLEFGGRPATIQVPFDSISTFSDPSTGFGLQFALPQQRGEKRTPEHVTHPPEMETGLLVGDSGKAKGGTPEIAELRPKTNESRPETAQLRPEGSSAPAGSACTPARNRSKVVSLQAWRSR